MHRTDGSRAISMTLRAMYQKLRIEMNSGGASFHLGCAVPMLVSDSDSINDDNAHGPT